MGRLALQGLLAAAVAALSLLAAPVDGSLPAPASTEGYVVHVEADGVVKAFAGSRNGHGASLQTSGVINGTVLVANPEDGCSTLQTGLTGSIVLIKRGGSCDDAAKVQAGQDAGAVAVLIYHDTTTNFRDFYNQNMDGDATGITIPSAYMILHDGEVLRDMIQTASSVTASIGGAVADRDIYAGDCLWFTERPAPRFLFRSGSCPDTNANLIFDQDFTTIIPGTFSDAGAPSFLRITITGQSFENLRAADFNFSFFHNNYFGGLFSVEGTSSNRHSLSRLTGDVLGGMRGLWEFRLKYTQIMSLPSGFLSTSLRTLTLNDNYISSIAADFFDGISSQLYEINLDNNRLSTLNGSLPEYGTQSISDRATGASTQGAAQQRERGRERHEGECRVEDRKRRGCVCWMSAWRLRVQCQCLGTVV